MASLLTFPYIPECPLMGLDTLLKQQNTTVQSLHFATKGSYDQTNSYFSGFARVYG